MSLRELYQTHYFYETDRRDQINNSLTIPLGVISLVSGAFLVIAREIDYPFNISETIQLYLLGLTAVSLILAAIFMGRAYWGYGYAHMPRAEEIRQYCENLKIHYISQNYTIDDANKLADEETLEYVESQYSVNAELNAENNDIKSANLFKANGFTMASVVFLVISAVPYVINSIEEPSEIQKVKITNLKELSMATPTPQPQSQQQPVPQPKPSPPPSRVIKEHVEPTLKK
ncbi:hypothetical protein [Methylovorus sp. MP688]|uniref:hypothetical protein n=1 Tax=Methylovorus sp. (strain MP688) TaxID=887061 RepID=UPI00059E2049|nr:hypothetical protein [Methylovorus sp. MP688]